MNCADCLVKVVITETMSSRKRTLDNLNETEGCSKCESSIKKQRITTDRIKEVFKNKKDQKQYIDILTALDKCDLVKITQIPNEISKQIAYQATGKLIECNFCDDDIIYLYGDDGDDYNGNEYDYVDEVYHKSREYGRFEEGYNSGWVEISYYCRECYFSGDIKKCEMECNTVYVISSTELCADCEMVACALCSSEEKTRCGICASWICDWSCSKYAICNNCLEYYMCINCKLENECICRERE